LKRKKNKYFLHIDISREEEKMQKSVVFRLILKKTNNKPTKNNHA
jgi:hypothetical protein